MQRRQQDLGRAGRLRWLAWALLVGWGAGWGTVRNARAEEVELAAREEQAIKQAVALVAPSVVRIETVGGIEKVGELLTGTGPTTGLIVSPDGYILSSSFNFIARPASILVTLPDGRRLPAEQVANDKLKMLTLLKVAAEGLTPAPAAPAESFRVGQWAIALGKTYDVAVPNVSLGIVSALGRIWGKAIQTDAKVSPMNYGGPLVDIEGRVLGILVPLSPQSTGDVAGVEWYDGGIGFAIPLVDAQAVLDRLKGGKDLLPGVLGAQIKVRDMYAGDVLIDQVRYNSPAQQAGLKSGDVIVGAAGEPITRVARLQYVLGTRYAGEKLSIQVRRGEEKLTVEVTLADKLVPYESGFLGVLPVRLATDAPAGPDAVSGVEIHDVLPGSPAEKAGLARGERIVSARGAAVPDAAALLDVVSLVRPGERLTLGVDGKAGRRDVEVTLAALPESVPAQVRPHVAPADRPAAPAAADRPKTGRINGRLEAHEHDYFAYVPDDYDPSVRYGLLVWLSPAGDPMENSILQAWKTHCDERDVILLAPRAKSVAGWTADEAPFIHDLIEEIRKTYTIDGRRIAAHGFAGGGPLAMFLTFKYRELFRGLLVVDSALPQTPPDNEPEFRVQMFVSCHAGSPLLGSVKPAVAKIQALKYPLVFTTLDDADQKYPGAAAVREMARWLDVLDQI